MAYTAHAPPHGLLKEKRRSMAAPLPLLILEPIYAQAARLLGGIPCHQAILANERRLIKDVKVRLDW